MSSDTISIYIVQSNNINKKHVITMDVPIPDVISENDAVVLLKRIREKYPVVHSRVFILKTATEVFYISKISGNDFKVVKIE